MRNGLLLKRKRRRCKCQRRRSCRVSEIRTSRTFQESPHIFCVLLLGLLRRVLPMEVTTVRSYGTQAEEYAICPNCGFAMEREYQNCCDYCGQRLGWTRFRRGQIIYLRPQFSEPSPIAIPLRREKESVLVSHS